MRLQRSSAIPTGIITPLSSRVGSEEKCIFGHVEHGVEWEVPDKQRELNSHQGLLIDKVMGPAINVVNANEGSIYLAVPGVRLLREKLGYLI